MERIKVSLPEHFNFSTEIPIRITDINYGNHVGNDTFLSLVHEARMQFLKQWGYSELDFGGASLIMADAAIEFKHELMYGDIVKAYVMATGFDRIGFDVYYKFTIIKNGSEILVAKAKTGMMCFDYNAKKKMSVPQQVINQLQ